MPLRSSTAGERTVLAATFRKTYYRVDIADPDGVMVDMQSHANFGWLYDVMLDETLDQPIAGCTVRLRREIDLAGGLGHTSLSPLRTDSPANPDGPAVTVYRTIHVYLAVVTGNRPSALSTDWKLKFDGVTDRISDISAFAMTVTARDKGAYLQDQWVRDTGSNLATGTNPRTLPDVLRDLLRYAPDRDGTVPTLYEPFTLASFVLTSFPLRYEPMMAAAQRAVALVGADFRYAWDDGSGAYRPTLTMPDRDTPTSEVTFTSADIVGWRQLELDRLGVRNQIILSYLPDTTNARTFATVEDTDSIADYGRRVLTLYEDDDSSIDTADEATDLLDRILADLKDPKATAEVEMLPDWRMELNTYGTFAANRFFDVDQDLAVVGIRYVLEPNRQRMFLTLRGNPSGGYLKWLQRAKDLPDENEMSPADNGISKIDFTESEATGTRTYTWERGANVAFIAFYEALATVPVTAAAFPDPANVIAMIAASTPGASILRRGLDSWAALKPPRSRQRIGMAVPHFKSGGRVLIGAPVKFIIDPAPNGGVTWYADKSEVTSTGIGTVVVVLLDPHASVDTTNRVKFYRTVNGVRTLVTPTTSPVAPATAGNYTLDSTLDPKHNITVEPVIYYVDGGVETIGAWMFDSDKVADVVSLTQAISGTTATVSAVFDQDTAVGAAQARYRVDGGSWTDFTVSGSLTGSFTVAQSTAIQTVEVQGKDSDGNYGTTATVLIGALVAPPTAAGFTAVTITASSAPNDDGTGSVTVAFSHVGFPTGTTFDISIDKTYAGVIDGSPTTGVTSYTGITSGAAHNVPDAYTDMAGIITVFAVFGGNVIGTGFVDFTSFDPP